MNWTREQLKSNARLMVKKNWLICVVVSLILYLVSGDFSNNVNVRSQGNSANSWTQYGSLVLPGWFRVWLPMFVGALFILMIAVIVLSLLFQFLVVNILTVGGCRFYLHNIHSKGEFGDIFFGYSNCFGNVARTMLMMDLRIFLWSLLFIIPGIVKVYEYRMVPYLLADNPELNYRDALEISRSMMDGEKINAFVLDLSFFLWHILSAITLGIVGILWVNPYQAATNAELYMALSSVAPAGKEPIF